MPVYLNVEFRKWRWVACLPKTGLTSGTRAGTAWPCRESSSRRERLWKALWSLMRCLKYCLVSLGSRALQSTQTTDREGEGGQHGSCD